MEQLLQLINESGLYVVISSLFLVGSIYIMKIFIEQYKEDREERKVERKAFQELNIRTTEVIERVNGTLLMINESQKNNNLRLDSIDEKIQDINTKVEDIDNKISRIQDERKR